MFGLKNRQDSNNFYREFQQAEGDTLIFLQRKSSFKEHFSIIESQVIKMPLLSLTDQYDLFKKENPSIKLSFATFRKYYAQIDCFKFKKSIEKWITENNLSYDKEKLIKELFDNSKNSSNKEIRKIAEQELALAQSDEAEQAEQKKIDRQIDFKTNFSNYTLSILICFFIACGLNFEVLTILFAISKTTAWRHFCRMDFLKDEITNSVTYWSGVVSVDEKWVWVNKQWLYVFSVVDNETGFLLYYHISESLKHQDWELFFMRFKQLYGTPKLIISDGSKSLAKGLKLVFPKVVHQLCKFHKIKNLYKRIYTVKDEKLRNKLLKLAKGIFNNKTYFGRKRCLLNLINISPDYVREYLEKNIKADWMKLTRGFTSNASERWNRKIEKVISKRYGIKTVNFLDILLASLWMKEAIKNQTHFENSFVNELSIPKIAKENVKMCNIIEFISKSLIRKVA